MKKFYENLSLNWFLSLVMLVPMTATAQETTQFATSVIDFSSEYQYSPSNYDADWALGDASDGRRWIPQNYDGQREYLVLGYSTPVEVYQIQIYEDWGAGAVDTIYLRNASTGEWNKVFSTTAAYAGYTRTFTVDIIQTPYLVDAIRLAISSQAIQNWNAILAVSITGVPPSPNPNVSITSLTSSITNALPIPVTFTFNESITGFDISDIIVTNGSAGNFSVLSSSVYTADIYPVQDGLVTVSVAANAATDEDSNGNLASRLLSRKYDITKPSVEMTGANPTSGNTIQVRFFTSELVSGFDSGDISVTNGYVYNFYPVDNDGDGFAEYYQGEIAPNETTSTSVISVDVAANVFTDLSGNENTAAEQFTTTHYPPQFASSVIGFSSQYYCCYQSDQALEAPNGGVWIPSGYDAAREYLELGFTTPLSVNVVEVYENWGSGAVDTIYLRNAITDVWNKVFSRTAAGGTYQDRLSINFPPTTYPVDGVRLAINSPAVTNWNAIDAVSISGIEVPEVLLKISSSAPAKTNVSPIPFTFIFSKPVTDFNLSDINITNGTAGNFIAVSERVYTSDITPTIPEGTITVSVAENAAIASNSNGNLAYAATRIFDSVAPTIVITSSAPNPTLDNSFPVTFTFNEVPVGFDASDIVVTNGSIQNFSQLQSTIYYGEVVPSGEGTVSVDVGSAAATDVSGNASLAATQFNMVYIYVAPQYASSVIGFSSQYYCCYQSDQALGAPNGGVWIPSGYDAAREFLELGFTTPLLVQRFDVYEDWGGGAIDTVYLRNALTGVWNKVYSTTAQNAAYTRTLTVHIETTDYPVDAIRLAINSPAVSNWNAIDAVSITGLPDPRPIVKITSTAPSTYNSPIPFTFTFSTDVTGFALGDISVTNGSAASLVAVSPSVYTADITPVVHGSIIATVAENGAINADAKGNYPSSAQSATAFFYGDRQYATSVIEFSSEYPYSSYYQSPQALNAPNGIWWIPFPQDANREYLKLGFSTPTQVARIEIYENWGAGAVDTVYLRNAATGAWNKVYSATALYVSYSRTLTINIPLTPYLVDAIRLAINSPAVSDWNSIDAVSISDIYRVTQTITFDPLVNKVYGGAPFALPASSASVNPISYISSDVNIATLNGNMATIVGVGTTTITASLAGSNSYAFPYSAAANVTQNLTVDKANQTITFAPLVTKKFADPSFTLAATIGTSPLPISYSSSNTSVATINGNTVTIVGVGSSIITASQAGNANYNPAPSVDQTLTVNKADQTISFSALRDRALSEASFTISTSGGASGNPVTLASSNTSVATVSGNTVTLVGLGTTNITASQTGNTNYNAAPNAIQPLIVNSKTSQSISFNALAAKSFGDAAFTLSATGGASGLPVTFTSSNASVATVNGTTVTIIGGGSATITASQAGNSTFNAANDVAQTLIVNSLSQTISFGALTAKTFGNAAFTLSASGGASGLPITFVSSNTLVATVSGNTLTIVGAGSTTITASQAGNSNYSAASNITQTLTVNKASQTIVFNAQSTAFGNTSFSFTATGGGSGLPVTFVSSNPNVATISGNSVTIIGVGTSNITASQAGNDNYTSASDVASTLTVNKADQIISFASLANKKFGDPNFTLSAPGGASGSPVTFASSDLSVATVSGNVVTIIGPGITTITASQAGSTNYNTATNATQNLTVDKKGQSITFSSLATKVFGDIPFTLSASGGSSGLPVTFTSSNSSVATISGNTVNIVGGGVTIIAASQAGNASYAAAANVTQNLVVNKASQSIIFSTLTDKTVGDVPFTPVATASSGLAVSFSSGSNKVSINGSLVSIVSAGRVSITANQSGNETYSEALSVNKSFCIKPAKPIISITGDDTSAPTLTSSAATGNQWYKNGAEISGATNASLDIKAPGVYKVQVSVDDCVSDFSSDAPLIITGDLTHRASGISIYPNPVEDYLEVSGLKSEFVTALVYDMVGHSFAITFKKEGKIHRANVQQMITGIYLLRITDETDIHQTKFIKK